MDINDLSYDILKEIFNISVGKSAKMLSEITDKKILLNIPNLKVLSDCKELDVRNEYLNRIPEGALMVSSIDFGDTLTGEANLIFPANKMRRFINLCMDDDNYVDDDMDFTDIDFDVVREVGNIILNSIIGGMGNLLNISLEYTLPKVELFKKEEFTSNVKNKDFSCMLLLYIDFIIEGTEIEGALIIDLTLNSLNELILLIQKAKDDLYG